MGYKIMGKEIKDGHYYTMIGSDDIFVFRGSGFKNLKEVNQTISKNRYHKFRPYFLQSGDEVHIAFTDAPTTDEDNLVKCMKIEYNVYADKYKLIYSFSTTFDGKSVLGSWYLDIFGIRKIKIC